MQTQTGWTERGKDSSTNFLCFDNSPRFCSAIMDLTMTVDVCGHYGHGSIRNFDIIDTDGDEKLGAWYGPINVKNE